MTPRPTTSHRFPDRGLTLAEVAMAIFIIGVGVLSIATVYLQRERAATITAQQSQAHRLADMMAQQIEKEQTAEVRYENAIGVRCAATPANVLNTTSQVKAVNDVACWQERVAAEMPSGAGSIAIDQTTVPPNYAVTVSWLQPRGGLASYTVRTPMKVGTGTPAGNVAATASGGQKPTVARAAN